MNSRLAKAIKREPVSKIVIIVERKVDKTMSVILGYLSTVLSVNSFMEKCDQH